MELSRKRLREFDLEEELDKKLLEGEDQQRFLGLYTTIGQIWTTDQFIRDCPSYPGSTDKIIRDELVSAIGATLAIEGTILRAEEIEQSFEKADLQENLQRKEQEAQNSKNVYSYIIDLVNKHDPKLTFKYSEEHIKQIHRYFTENIDYIGNVPGQYRDMTAMFGDPRRISLYKQKAEIEQVMPKFIAWLNDPSSGILTGKPIIKAIMAHYYLVEIHPFADGNGRTARALEALVLYVNSINNYCFWSLANFWSTHRNEYVVHLGNIRSTCDPSDFLLWGTQGYLEEVERIKALVLMKLKQLMFIDYTRWLLTAKQSQQVRINKRIQAVVQFLAKTGPMSHKEFMSSPGMVMLYSKVKSYTKSRDFSKMKELNLICIFDHNGQKFIAANFQKLERLEYTVWQKPR